MPKYELRMDVLGASFSILADEDPVYLENLLNRYRLTIESAQKVTGLSDPLKIAIVTGFLLCDEVQKLQDDQNTARSIQEESDQVEQLTRTLIARIDAALGKQS